MSAITDDDLDLGGRVFLVDSFSAVAARIGQNFARLRGGFAANTAAVAASARSLTDGLRRAAQEGGAAAAGLAGAVQRGWDAFAHPRGDSGKFLQSPLTRVRTWTAQAEGQIRAFARRGSAILDGVGRSFRRGLDALTSSLGGLSRYLSPSGLIGGFADLVAASGRAASAMENNRLAFTTLLGSAELARAHLAELQQFAIGRPFEFADLVTQSRYLQTFGFHVGEITGLLTDFGNAAFTANTGIRGVNVMSRVFGTILATNKTTFGQLRQLVSAGIPAFQILRDELHLNDEQLQKIARSGIPATTVIAALRRGMQARFSGGMDRAAQTLTARLSDLQDVAGQFLTMVGDELRPVLSGFLGEFSGALGTTETRMRAARIVSDTLVTGLRMLRGILAILGGAITDTSERWNAGTGRIARDWRTTFATVRDVTEGVVALLSASNSRGVAQIPRGLHDALVRKGLWPLVFRIAQWGDRVRQVVGGFLAGMGAEIRRSGAQFRAVAEGLGLLQPGMRMNRAEAFALGQNIVRLVRGYTELRVAMFGLSAASTAVSATMTLAKAVGTVGGWLLSGIGLLARFVRWLPIAAAWVGRLGSFFRALGMVASRVLGGLGLGSIGTILAIITAQVAGLIVYWRNWDRLQAHTWKAFGLRTLASALMPGWTGLIDVIKQAPKWWGDIVRAAQRLRPIVAAIGGWLVGAFRAALGWVGRGLFAVGRWLWRGFVAVFAPLGRFFHLLGSFVVVALYVAFATLWIKVRGPVMAFGRWVRGELTAAGQWVRGLALGVLTWAVGVAASAALVVSHVRDRLHAMALGVLGRMAVVASAAVALGQRVRSAIGGAFTRLGSAVGGFFARLERRALTFFAPLLGRAARFATGLRTLLGGAFQWVADTASRTFSRLADAILSPLRSIARSLVGLFQALPRNLQPAGLAGMVTTLAAFGGGGGPSGGPVGGPPPGPAPAGPEGGAPSPAAPPVPESVQRAAPTVPQSVQRRAGAQAQAAGRGAATPTVHVTVPPPVVAAVHVSIDGRQVAAAVDRQHESDRLRGGQSGR